MPKLKTRGGYKSEGQDLGFRLTCIKMFACLALGLLGLRLWYLQGIYGPYYRDMSENNRTRTIRTSAPRGIIYDREGKILVRNRPAFDVALLLEDTPDVSETVTRLAHITGRNPEQVLKDFRSRKKRTPFEPSVVLPDVSREELAKVKVNTHLLPGVIVNTVPARAYPSESLAAQLFGYVREITKDQLERNSSHYRRGDLIGQSGVEKKFENYLRGKSGYIQVEVDAHGARKGELGIADDIVGQDLHLTLDQDVQQAAERALGGYRGAVVAIEPSTGEILALASTPTFDARLFSGQVALKDWEQLNSDSNKPLTNRALASAYPPGSVIKLLWSIAGLNEGLITPNTKVNCHGSYQLGRRRYRCHKHSGHGTVDLRAALRQSCNVYFYQLGQTLGIETMHKYLGMFGFGQPTGVDLFGEEAGTNPSPQWKQARFNERWYPGDSVPVSIGQGYLIVTPLQLANFAATLANGGRLYRPMLLKHVINPVTGQSEAFAPELKSDVPVSTSVFNSVKEFSADVVQHEQGTGKRAAIPGIMIGGKTGTSQTRAGLRKNPADEKLRDHAWFVAYAPVENPTIALSVIVENSGGGGMFAAPVAREVMIAHFLKKGMITKEDLLPKKDKDKAKPKVEPVPEVQPEPVVPDTESETFEIEEEPVADEVDAVRARLSEPALSEEIQQ